MKNNENIILYSTGCPRCEILKMKLKEKKIKYTVETDVEKMLSYGIYDVPYLQVGDQLYDFREAFHWVNEQGDTE